MRLLITGMHRSGTSLLANLIARFGFFMGADDAFNEADESNPKGYWENKTFLDINERLLQASGAAWDKPSEFAVSKIDQLILAELVKDAEALIAELDNHSHWALKDPRASITMPFWSEVLGEFSVLAAVRQPLQVAESLRKRNGYPIQFGVCLWEYYTRNIINSMPASKISVIEHASLFASSDDLKSTILGALRKVGLLSGFDAQKVCLKGVVENDLYRSKAEQLNNKVMLSQAQIQLFEVLRDHSWNTLPVNVMDPKDLRLMVEFGETLKNHDQSIDILNLILEQRDNELGNAKQEISSYVGEIDKYRASNEATLDYVETLEAELSRVRASLDKERTQFEQRLESEAERLQAINQKLQFKLDDALVYRQKLEQAKHALDEKIAQLQAEVADTDKDDAAAQPATSLSEELEHAKSYITELARCLRSREQEIVDLKEYVTSLEGVNKEHSLSLADAANYCASLEAEIEKLTKYSKSLEIENAGGEQI